MNSLCRQRIAVVIGGPIGGLVWALPLLLCLLAVPAPGQAQAERILSVQLMTDPTATLEADAAARESFSAVGHTLTLGYVDAAQWLRLRILPAPDGGEVVLLVRPPLLDDVRLYVPVFASADDRDPRAGPPRYALQPADWPSSLRGYRLRPPPGGAEYLVRISSSGSMAVSVTARTPAEAVRISLVSDLVQISYFAGMLILLVWALRILAVTREGLFAWFAAMQAVFLLHNFLAFGYGTSLAPDIDRETVTFMFRSLVFGATFLSVAFHRAFLIRFRPAAAALRLFDIQIAMILVAFAIFWVFDSRLGLKINAYCIAVTPFVLLFNLFSARHEASPGLLTTRIIYVLLSVLLLLWIFALLGFVNVALFALYGFMLHGTTTGILVFAILHMYNLKLAETARAVEARLAEVEQDHKLQQAKTRTLAQFIDMLTHEARNALAVINMSVSGPTLSERQRLRVAGAIQGLTGVFDRCNQTIRLDSNELAITRRDCDLAGILGPLCADTSRSARIDLRLDTPAVIQGDPVMLGVVFGNLIDNALKYSPPGSPVGVVLERVADGVRVAVENAEGAAGRPDPGRVFEKYYRSDRAKAQIGSGLGLYIVRGLVHLMDGRIAYAPTDRHLRFEVWFPC